MKTKMIAWLTMLLFFLLVPLGVMAKNPAPYISEQKAGTPAMVVFGEIMKLPESSTARIEFFKESKKNFKSKTGYDLTEKDFAELFRHGKVKVELCGNCQLETAGIENNQSKYWRLLNPSEEMASAEIYGQSVPWFLIRCANPVRDIERIVTVTEPPPEVIPQQPEPKPAQFRPVGCIQGAPIQLLGSSTIRSGIGYSPWSGYGGGGGDVSHHNNVIFYPTDCISESDYQKEGLNENN